MKKLSILLLAAIYLVSLSAGFLFAGYRQASTNPSPVEDARQANWILIRVNDMTLEKPQLVSIWAMFLTFSPGPQLFFKPIYSVEWNDPASSVLASKFSVSVDRNLSQKFVTELDRLNIHRTGLVILDDDGFQNFTNWFSKPGVALAEPEVLIPVVGKAAFNSPEAQAYNQVCTTLRTSNGLNPTDIPWKKLVPDHLLPHPSLEALASIWKQVMLSSTPAHCEVLVAK